MKLGRSLAVLLVAGVAGAIAVERSASEPEPPPEFGVAVEPGSPAIVLGSGGLSQSWFCPGGPTANDQATSLTIFNPQDGPRAVRLTAYPADAQPVSRPLELGPHDRETVAIGEFAPSPFTAATVEVFGEGVLVEQTVTTPVGRSTTACATSASDTWYFADGVTTIDAAYSLALFNPFAQAASVDVRFATAEGDRAPGDLQGISVPAAGVRLIDIGAFVQREAAFSTIVETRRGRVVAGRLQSVDRRGRRGIAAGPGAPRPGDTWWFPDGEKGEAAGEQYVVYNPNPVDAAVALSFFPGEGIPGATPATTAPTTPPPSPAPTTATGASGPGTTSAATTSTTTSSTSTTSTTSTTEPGTTVPPTTPGELLAGAAVVSLLVPAGEFRVVDVTNNPDVPPGRHDVVVSLEGDDTPVVVERVLNRIRDDRSTTSTLLGSRIVSATWYVADASASAEGVLVVMNGAGLSTNVTVNVIGPAGPVPVPGLVDLQVPTGGILEQSIPASVAGMPLKVEGSGPIVVEWRARAGGEIPGLVQSFAVAELG
ncbi:MAG TPA: DUF5719 family protein [Acidimicrobiales bacterium]|jgi:hypothetical protein|nr:DUF5719 family protein [Acidimicrobiales bacterium]